MLANLLCMESGMRSDFSIQNCVNRGSKGIAKHLFSDMPTAVTETSPVTMPKMYGKPCRHGLPYGNLKSTVFRLCWSVTCASHPPAALHQEELAARNLQGLC